MTYPLADELQEIKQIPVYEYFTLCWKCKERTPIRTYHFLIDYNYTLGDQPKLDRMMLERYPSIKRVFSKTKNAEDTQNTCAVCGANQGNWYVAREIAESLDSLSPIDSLPNVLEPRDLYEYKE